MPTEYSANIEECMEKINTRLGHLEIKFDSIEERISALEAGGSTRADALVRLEGSFESLEKTVGHNGEGQSILFTMRRVLVLIDGDDSLGIRGMRHELKELVTERNRLRWMVAGFGIQAVGWLWLIYRFGNLLLQHDPSLIPGP